MDGKTLANKLNYIGVEKAARKLLLESNVAK